SLTSHLILSLPLSKSPIRCLVLVELLEFASIPFLPWLFFTSGKQSRWPARLGEQIERWKLSVGQEGFKQLVHGAPFCGGRCERPARRLGSGAVREPRCPVDDGERRQAGPRNISQENLWEHDSRSLLLRIQNFDGNFRVNSFPTQLAAQLGARPPEELTWHGSAAPARGW
ncbi:unnamed protein product, partial [Urochloa humidicola]